MRASILTLATLAATLGSEARAACGTATPTHCVSMSVGLNSHAPARCDSGTPHEIQQVEQFFAVPVTSPHWPDIVASLSLPAADQCYMVVFHHVSRLNADLGPMGEASEAHYAGVVEIDALGDYHTASIAESAYAPHVVPMGSETIRRKIVEITPASGGSSIELYYTGDLMTPPDGNEVSCEVGGPGSSGQALATSFIDVNYSPYSGFGPYFCYAL